MAQGWPGQDTSFTERFLDEELKLELVVSETHAAVLLGMEERRIQFWSVGNVKFGLDDLGFLRAIAVGALSAQQSTLLAELALPRQGR